MQLAFKEVALVALSHSDRSSQAVRGPTQHQLAAEMPRRAFAHLVFRLPSDSAAGAVTVTRNERTVVRQAEHSRFASMFTAAYCDCEITLSVDEPGHAIFVVYALTLPKVR